MNFRNFNELSFFVLKYKKNVKLLFKINQQLDEIEKILLPLLWQIWTITQPKPEIANEVFNEICYYVNNEKTFKVSLETFALESSNKLKRKLSQREIATQLGLNQSDISKRLRKRQCILKDFVGTQS